MKKRILSLVLTLAICVTFMPTVFFQSAQEVNAAEVIDNVYNYSINYHSGNNGVFYEDGGDVLADRGLIDEYVEYNLTYNSRNSVSANVRAASWHIDGETRIHYPTFRFPNLLVDYLVPKLAQAEANYVTSGLVVDEDYVFTGWYLGKDKDAEEYSFPLIQAGNNITDGSVPTAAWGQTPSPVTSLNLYAHYEKKTDVHNHQASNWAYFMKTDAYYDVFEAAGFVDGVYHSINSFKSLNSFTDADTVYAVCKNGDNACGKEQSISISTENSVYTGEAVEATVDATNWTASGLEKYEVKYFDYGEIQKALRKYTYVERLDKIEVVTRESWDYIVPMTSAPKKPGEYVAVLLPEDASLDYIREYVFGGLKAFKTAAGGETLYSPFAFSFFTIQYEKDNWTYYNKYGQNTDVTDVTGLKLKMDLDILGHTGLFTEDSFTIGEHAGEKLIDGKATGELPLVVGGNYLTGKANFRDYDEFEELLKDTDNDTVYAENEGTKQKISLSVDSKKYDGEAVTANVDDSKWTENGLINYVVRYLDYGKLQDMYRDLYKDIDKLNSRISEYGSGAYYYLNNNVSAWRSAHLLSKTAPKEAGMYVALLLPEDITTEDIINLFYSNMFTKNHSWGIVHPALSEYKDYEEDEAFMSWLIDEPAAYTFFEITPNQELCNHVWQYSGPSGDFGSGVYDVIYEALDEYGLVEIIDRISDLFDKKPKDREEKVPAEEAGALLNEFVKEIEEVEAVGSKEESGFIEKYGEIIGLVLDLFNEDNGLLETLAYGKGLFTPEEYNKLAKKLNKLTARIVVKCETCEKTQYMDLVAPTKAGEPVTFDKTHWTDDSADREMETYYVNLDNVADSLGKTLKVVQRDIITPINLILDAFASGDLEQLESITIDDPIIKLALDYIGLDGTAEKSIDDFANLNEAIKVAMTILDDLLDSLVIDQLDSLTDSDDVPTKPGKYIAFTKFVNEDGSVVEYKELVKELKGLINKSSRDDDLHKSNKKEIVDSLGETVKSLFQGGVVFYAIEGTTTNDTLVAQSVAQKIDKLNKLNTTYNSKDVAAVKAATNAYNQLSDKQKILLKQDGHYNALNTAIQKINFMSKTAKTPNVTAKKGKNVVKWSKVTGATKYRVYRATKKSGKYYYRYQTTKTTYNNTAVKKGKKYYYKVRASKKIGNQTVYTKLSSAKSVKAK